MDAFSLRRCGRTMGTISCLLKELNRKFYPGVTFGDDPENYTLNKLIPSFDFELLRKSKRPPGSSTQSPLFICIF